MVLLKCSERFEWLSYNKIKHNKYVAMKLMMYNLKPFEKVETKIGEHILSYMYEGMRKHNKDKDECYIS